MNQQRTPVAAHELIATVVSCAIVLGSICYWLIQIEGVQAMLKLADG